MRILPKIFICFLAYAIIPFSMGAQNSEVLKNEFTLSEAIDFAIANNRSSKNSLLNIEAAKQQKWETTAMGLPQINGKIEYTNYIQYPLTDEMLEGFPLAAFMFPKYSLTPSVTLSQLIFDGSYIVALQSAKVFLDITKNAKIKTELEVTKAVTGAYNNVLLTEESCKLIEKNIINIKKNLEDSKIMLANGFVEEEDIEQLQITLNNLENNLNSLKQMHVISLKMLKLTLGISNNKEIRLTEGLHTLIQRTTSKATTLENFSVFNNIDYQIAENETTSKKLLYNLEKAKLLPSIRGFVAGSNIGNSQSFSFFEKSQTWISTALVGVNIDIPIFSSFGSTAKRKRAKIDWKISQNKLIDTEQQIEINYEKAQSDLDLALNTLENKILNLRLAERIENKNNIKYKEGIASSFELRQAQMQLYSSQQEYLQAMVNVINKKTELNALQN